MVHTGEDGVILVQFQRWTVTESVRLDADAATWAALEAVTRGGECLRFESVQVTVDYDSPYSDAVAACAPAQGSLLDASDVENECQVLHAKAHVAMADLILWSLGEIDDAELALRLDYQPPVVPPDAWIAPAATP
jgi:hypothetical protein